MLKAIHGAIASSAVRISWVSDPWNVANGVYDSVSSDTSAENSPTGMFFRPNGLSVYIVGFANETVYQYDLSAAWDLSTKSSTPDDSYSVATETGGLAGGLCFSSDGTKMYVASGNGTNPEVHQWTLTTAWDLSGTVTFNHSTIYIASGTPRSIRFNSGGTKMLLLDTLNDDIYEFSLTAWDASTISLVDTYDIGTNGGNFNGSGLAFKTDGKEMYVTNGPAGSTDDITQYTLTTGWDLSTASLTTQILLVGDVDSLAGDIYWKDDGTKLYFIGSTNDDIYQYSV